MSDGLVEIRVHGRGGQGNVAAAELLALAAFDDGYQVQAFPAFGAERMGSPVQAFVRLSNRPIRLRSQVYEPDVVIVQDPFLSRTAEVAGGLKPGGYLVLNADAPPASLPEDPSIRVFTVPATAIALEALGRPIPNAVMLGAFVGATRLIELSSLTDAIAERFEGDLGMANARAALLGFDRVQEVFGPRASAAAAPRCAARPACMGQVLDALPPGSTRGYLTGAWRTSRPVFSYERCNGCDLCAVYCPEGVITSSSKTHYSADYDFCKGCGICARECPVGDIHMVPESIA